MLTLVLTVLLVQEDRFPLNLSPGVECRVGAENKKTLGATNYIWYRRLGELIKAEDVTGAQEMVSKGYVRIIEPKTDAKVIKVTGSYAEVRLLSGKWRGEAVYVDADTLTHAPTAEEIDAEKQRQITEAKEAEATKQRAADRHKTEKSESKKAAELAKETKAKEEYEARAAELLKQAKRWLNEEKNPETATARLEDLMRRFPKSAVADEAKKMLASIKK